MYELLVVMIALGAVALCVLPAMFMFSGQEIKRDSRRDENRADPADAAFTDYHPAGKLSRGADNWWRGAPVGSLKPASSAPNRRSAGSFPDQPPSP
ncbi:hypothetical protein GCM10010198_40410 [Nocardia seriolae]|nr:hypothetical protein NSERKGN1266_64490 [Nocardia seriolae]BEK98247.1 hypothetical protein NSER024013_61530 [Nocardia seriolae]